MNMPKQTNIALLLFSVLLLLPTGSLSKRRFFLTDTTEQYAAIFDAGSTGSRVHVFRFDQYLNLLKFGDDFEVFLKVSPGLSDYAKDPKAGAQSLKPLLTAAENVIPEELRSKTPVTLGATAGLRMLEGDASERILEEVRYLFANDSSLLYKADWVSILDGYHEGAYMWVAMNYLLHKLGEEYSETVATIDLGGGSVQMAYAIPNAYAKNSPKTSNLEDPNYVNDIFLAGIDYSVYAHSYLNYGGKAARAGNLAFSKNSSNPCVTSGYNGLYNYGGILYEVKSSPFGANIKKCRNLTRKLLKLNAPCVTGSCSFDGVWNGGGGAGQKNIYVTSFFYGSANQAGLIEFDAASGSVRPIDYLRAANIACRTRVENMESTFPHIEQNNLPYFCMDLVYEYTLLVEGFGLNPFQKLTTVESIKYQNSPVEVAWPLGYAIDVVSAMFKVSYQNMIKANIEESSVDALTIA